MGNKKGSKNRKTKFSANRKRFAAMLANVDDFGDFTLVDFAKYLGIGTATVSRWKNDSEVIELANQLSNDSLKKFLPKINSMVVDKALTGKDITAANTFFKRLDRQELAGKGYTELSPDDVFLMVRGGKGKDD